MGRKSLPRKAPALRVAAPLREMQLTSPPDSPETAPRRLSTFDIGPPVRVQSVPMVDTDDDTDDEDFDANDIDGWFKAIPKVRVREAMCSGYREDFELPDRVPVFCQLAIGHYFLHSGLDPLDIWFRPEAYAEALVKLARRYRFDGVLVNLPGRDPAFERYIDRVESGDSGKVIRWKNGCYTVVPVDDCPHYFHPDGKRHFPAFEEIDPEKLFYVEPWDITEVSHPYTWGFETSGRSPEDFFPEYHIRALDCVLRSVGHATGKELSVHCEVFSPFSQFLELLGCENALLAIADDKGKVHACLERLTQGARYLAERYGRCLVDAVLISSAFAGAGFISRSHYEEFVLPYERELISTVTETYTFLPMYTHTCGSIGDRLDLLLETGTMGIDTLDPPPLGTVELADAKRILEGQAFIKGNIDPVNTLLKGDPASVREEARRKIAIGKPGGGYILSSACSVPPATPPENLEVLIEVAEEHGRY